MDTGYKEMERFEKREGGEKRKDVRDVLHL